MLKYIICAGTEIHRCAALTPDDYVAWEIFVTTKDVVYDEFDRFWKSTGLKDLPATEEQITDSNCYYEFKIPPNKEKYVRIAVLHERVKIVKEEEE